MSERNFMELLRARWAQDKFVCVGAGPSSPQAVPILPRRPTVRPKKLDRLIRKVLVRVNANQHQPTSTSQG